MSETLEILHVDMDAFFAAIEQLDRPELRGKPILVGGNGKRGVVSTASYEARKFGCHSAQPISVALRRCPQAIVVPVRGERYREVSEQVFEIFDRFTPLVEPLSVDEAFLDLHGTQRLHGSTVDAARRIRETIQSELHLTASVGVAPNKFLAKLASDLDKPDGLTVMSHEEYDRRVSELPITKIWGLGPASAEKFQRFGIRTVADLRRLPEEWLVRRYGSAGTHFHRLAWGLDDRRVTPDHDAKSIGQERTFEENLRDPEFVRGFLLRNVEQVGRRLRRHGFKAQTMTVKIRYGDFHTITRRCKLFSATDSTEDLWTAAKGLFDEWADKQFQPVRLIGATTSDFISNTTQEILFPDPRREARSVVDRATDRIIDRFGSGSISRAAGLLPGGNAAKKDRSETEETFKSRRDPSGEAEDTKP